MDACKHDPKCISAPPSLEEFRCCALGTDELCSDASAPTPEYADSQQLVEHIRSQDFSDMPPVEEEVPTAADLGFTLFASSPPQFQTQSSDLPQYDQSLVQAETMDYQPTSTTDDQIPPTSSTGSMDSS
jgi:hypothetical protein